MINIRTLKKAMSFGTRHITQVIDYYLEKGFTRPDRVSLNLTRRCNAKCIMCDFWRTAAREQNEISAEKWVETLEELHKWIGPFTLVLSGGEIFVKKGIYDIIKRAIDLNISLDILTNGIVFRSDENLRKLYDTGLSSIVFSLDGMIPEIHDKFRGREGLHKTVIDAIAKIKKQNPKMNIATMCIVMKDTISQMVDYVHWAKNLGIKSVQFQPMTPNFGSDDIVDGNWYKTNEFFIHDIDLVNEVMDELIRLRRKDNFIGNTEDHLEKIKDYFRNPNIVQAKQTRCMLGQTNININEYGDISFCYNFDNNFGNINDGPIKKTWRSSKANKFRKQIKHCRLPCLALCARSFTLMEKIVLFFKYAKMGKV